MKLNKSKAYVTAVTIACISVGIQSSKLVRTFMDSYKYIGTHREETIRYQTELLEIEKKYLESEDYEEERVEKEKARIKHDEISIEHSKESLEVDKKIGKQISFLLLSIAVLVLVYNIREFI